MEYWLHGNRQNMHLRHTTIPLHMKRKNMAVMATMTTTMLVMAMTIVVEEDDDDGSYGEDDKE